MIGVVAALESEVATLRKRPRDFMAIACGMGEVRAYAAALRLAGNGVSALVSWGCAAALESGLNPGTLVVATAVIGDGTTRYVPDDAWRHAFAAAVSTRSMRVGALAYASKMLSDSQEKRALGARSGAIAADMESAAIARAAHESGLPFLAIRAVADGAGIAVPRELVRTVSDDGTLNVAGGVARLVVSPWQWGSALRLGLAFNSALVALRAAAPALYGSAPRTPQPIAVAASLEEQGAACAVRA